MNTIEVSPVDAKPPYNASKMSDGERAIFYLIAQTLLAPTGFLLIFDEPELHVHPAINGKLWDALEAARSDCAFLMLTHDLNLAAERPGQKYLVRSYTNPGFWDIDRVPDGIGFNEQITTLILGSQKPILFVEGTGRSLDLAVYRSLYQDFTVLPRGSCQEVIHAVMSLRRHYDLVGKRCAGIVD